MYKNVPRIFLLVIYTHNFISYFDSITHASNRHWYKNNIVLYLRPINTHTIWWDIGYHRILYSSERWRTWIKQHKSCNSTVQTSDRSILRLFLKIYRTSKLVSHAEHSSFSFASSAAERDWFVDSVTYRCWPYSFIGKRGSEPCPFRSLYNVHGQDSIHTWRVQMVIFGIVHIVMSFNMHLFSCSLYFILYLK